MDAGKGNQRYFRTDARCRLVCTAAGRLQADAECKGRNYRRSSGRDNWMLRHDAFGSDGRRNFDWKDAFGSAEHGPRMRELFLQIVYGRSQSAFSEGGLAIGAGLEDLGKGTRSQVGTIYSTKAKGPRYLELAEGYITEIGLDEEGNIIGYKYVNMGKMMDAIKAGIDPLEAIEKASGKYGRFDEAAKTIDPREE